MFHSNFSASPFVQGANMQNMEMAILQARQMMPQQQQQVTAIDRVTEIVSGLSQEEQMHLANSEQFSSAKALFDRTFLDFMQNKYKQEFMNTQRGQQVAQNLLDTTNGVVGSVREQSRLEREKLSRLTRLLEDNPNLLNELEAKRNGKETK